VAKFIPGVNTAAPPLAGIFSMNFLRFFFFDGLGTLLWVGTLIGLGFLFREQLQQIVVYAAALSRNLSVVAICGLVAFIFWKYVHRRRFLHQVLAARISPEELKQKVDAGESIVIIDVRHSMDFNAHPYSIPGSMLIPLENLGRRRQLYEVLCESEVVICCA